MIKKKVNGSIMNFANMSEAQSGDNSITAFVEVSPAEAAHNIDDYIVYNHIIYQVIDNISIGDTLVVNTNIEQVVLPEGTVIYSNDEQGNTDSLSYNDLSDKPQIAGTTLQGNKTLADLGIQSELTFDNAPTDGSDNPVKSDGIYDSEKDIYAVMGERGAKNLIPYPYDSNSYSQRDIDFTCLSDGTINATGTNDGTGNSTYIFVIFTLSKGSYVINGCPTQTGNNYRCGVIRVSDSVTIASDYGSGAEFTLDADTDVRVFVQVLNGKTANNIIFKPMLRLASDTDDTYQPYAKTNKQLTDDVANKVDKVEGKGLSTNDYDNTEKGKVADNTSAIEAIVNEYGACNVFAIDNPILLTGVNVSNNGIINTNTDAIQLFNFMFRAFVSDSPITLANEYISETGDYIFNVTIPNNTQRLMFKHDGANNDLAITIPSVPAGDYKLTFTVVGCDPSTVGGLDISNIMLYDARLNPTGYVPYAMTNRELTERVSVTSGTTNHPNVTWKRFGNIVVVSVDGATTGTALTGLPTPASYALSFVCVSGTSNIGGYIQVVPGGTSNLHVESGSVYGSLTYICEG